MEQHTLRRHGLGLRGVDVRRVSPGYVLYAPLTSKTAHLVSTTGKEVHRWNLPYRAGRHARILPGGNLAFNGAHPEAPSLFPLWAKYHGGMMLQVSPDGTIMRQYSDPLAHHDQNHLDDDTILYTTLEPLSTEEASRVQGGIPGSEAPNGIIYGDCIKLVQPWSTNSVSSSADFSGNGQSGAKLLWSWRAIDHLDPKLFANYLNYSRQHWPLINSVALNSEGNIIASSRNASTVFIISRDTGAVLWYVSAPIVSQQHCVEELNSAGDILVFDDVTEGGEVVWEYVVPQLGEFKGVMPAEELEELKKAESSHPSNAVFRAYKYRPEEVPWIRE
ncbi:hypothetical protein N7457_005068 [Penicillium paradoxum]|uniref:uncharacterized protein n=1 Tax=Penicillium paradoxum TaxID=176176 RepID=UPI00254737A2|nr:uncharacterized protein N7457_005068 [Penicillium paradoxum]KAJ5779908.1 hypothetical protein N7457_005068 [Penicillium paradoxum]